MRTTLISAAAVAALVTGTFSGVLPAQAADPTDPVTITTVVTGAADDTYTSEFSITVDATSAFAAQKQMQMMQADATDVGYVVPGPYDDAFEQLAADGDDGNDPGDGGDGSTPAALNRTGATAASSAPQDLYCNSSYQISDFNGTFSYQHRCAGTTAPWGYKISAAVRRIVVGTVNEQGMKWTLNGVAQRTSTGHPAVVSYYQFHGTWKPVRDHNVVTYSDKITFNCNIGSNCHGTLSISGAIRNATL
jgi:hypothetical protein